jgi:TolB-like protein/class 3 adenylate cyclase
MERRLAAILAADVVGYSRLMGENEAGTLAALKTHRKELLKPKAAQYHGRTVKLMGDGELMEFASVVDAVTFAVEVQAAMAARNEEVPEDRRIVFRIGINVGDIIVEGDDIHGDGVNVAARLEALAEPGGICVARNVFDQVKDKLDLTFDNLGEKEVKNIAEPVTVYRVVLDDMAAKLVTPVVQSAGKPGRPGWIAAAVAVIVLLLVAGGAFWLQPWAPDVEPASVERVANPLSGKPSIAVLPFDNMSDDPSQDYFADGITEDLITDLSKISGLFVIARNSSFSYKGQQVKVRQVAEDLGVRYVLEGSVRRVGDQVRINAQLIDATTAGHLWAERYDGTLADVFALQDEVTGSIVAALALNLTEGEARLRSQKETNVPEAYDAFLQGWAHYIRRTPADYADAAKHFKRAIALDADYSRAYAALASTYWEGWERWWYKQLGFDEWMGPRKQAEQYLEIALRKPTALAHQVASEVRRQQGRHEDMIHEAETAVRLDPNDPNSYIALTWALALDGNAEDALAAVDRAMVLDPHYPAFYLYLKGFVYFSLEQYEQAAEFLERALERNPVNFSPNVILIPTYAHLGRIDAAKERLAKHPLPLSIDWVKYYWRYKRPDDMARLADGLRHAGVPDVAKDAPAPPKN